MRSISSPDLHMFEKKTEFERMEDKTMYEFSLKKGAEGASNCADFLCLAEAWREICPRCECHYITLVSILLVTIDLASNPSLNGIDSKFNNMHFEHTCRAVMRHR